MEARVRAIAFLVVFFLSPPPPPRTDGARRAARAVCTRPPYGRWRAALVCAAVRALCLLPCACHVPPYPAASVSRRWCPPLLLPFAAARHAIAVQVAKDDGGGAPSRPPLLSADVQHCSRNGGGGRREVHTKREKHRCRVAPTSGRQRGPTRARKQGIPSGATGAIQGHTPTTREKKQGAGQTNKHMTASGALPPRHAFPPPCPTTVPRTGGERAQGAHPLGRWDNCGPAGSAPAPTGHPPPDRPPPLVPHPASPWAWRGAAAAARPPRRSAVAEPAGPARHGSAVRRKILW